MKHRWMYVVLALCVIPTARAQFNVVGQQSPESGWFIRVADINGDGLDDLVDEFTIRINQGGGHFGPAITPFASERIMAVLDFNGDGFADLITRDANTVIIPPSLPQPPLPSRIYHLYRGRGDGTFARVGDLPFAEEPRPGDFDGDGKDDIVAFGGQSRNDLPGPVAFYHSNGDGTFTLTDSQLMPGGPVMGNNPQTGSCGGRVAVGDVNHDGIPDVVVRTVNGISVFTGKGNGKFDQVSHYFAGTLEGLDIVDVDGDGNLDLAFMDQTTFSVLYGDGTGHFPRTAAFVPPNQPSGPHNAGDYVVGQFTAAHQQVAVTNSNGDLFIISSKPDGTFQQDAHVNTGLYFLVIGYPGRFDKPGKRDLVVSGWTKPDPAGDYVAQAFLTAGRTSPSSHHRAAGVIPSRQVAPSVTVPDEHISVSISDACTSYFEMWSLGVDGAFRTDTAPKAGRTLEVAAFRGLYYFRVLPDGSDSTVAPAWGYFDLNTGTGSVWGKDSCRGWENMRLTATKQ